MNWDAIKKILRQKNTALEKTRKFRKTTPAIGAGYTRKFQRNRIRFPERILKAYKDQVFID
jgi:ribosomal protein S30